ncbi:MAG: hypothetical protein ACFFAN_12790 [Promethearchaeota archaeon]
MTKEKNYNVIRTKIFEWFDKNKNNYPWRNTKDLFQILISEILLQKTIASNVANLYEVFFKKYKCFLDIIQTDIAELQSDIKSLGLSNKRAQILRDLSELVLDKYNGKIPEDSEKLREVKGISDYVSNAYLCFGLNKKTYFQDVNIKRFISRIFAQEVKNPIIKEILTKILPDSDYKCFYWGLLDFGSKICTKKKPKCEICPLNCLCNYYKS